MEEGELFRQRIIIVVILLLILGPIFLYVYLERGSEGFIDWFFNGIIGLMFTGFMIMFVLPQFEKLYHKLFKKQTMEVAGTSWAGPAIDLNPEHPLVDRMYYAIYFREDGTFQFTPYLKYDKAMNHHSRHFKPQVQNWMKSDPSITPEQVYAKYKWKQDGNLVQLSFNDGFMIWEGSIDNGVMSGSQRNDNGYEGIFSLEYRLTEGPF
tara:strand:+ start:49 stop:672 length:624 start_codon:yes stop_codon:yes gene_type:complete